MPWTINLQQVYSVYRFGWSWRVSPRLNFNFELGLTSSFSTAMQSSLDTKGRDLSEIDKENMRKDKEGSIRGFFYNTTLPMSAMSLNYRIQ